MYLHIFPNGKKYVGCTSNPVKKRWDGGLGYSTNKRMLSAILRSGWENIRYYVLCEGLDKETALATEAMLIREWKTHQTGKGYNTMFVPAHWEYINTNTEEKEDKHD